ncbi:MAG: HEPN domain-containing protein [Roseivirga sp.]
MSKVCVKSKKRKNAYLVYDMEEERNIFTSTLAHLPEEKRYELALIVKVIQRKVNPKLLEKIILFGSYATGKWVEDTYIENGTTYAYKSDYDILVVTRGKEEMGNWVIPQIRSLLRKEEGIGGVSVIHHTLNFLNERIKNQYYFFIDIFRQGILLYDAGRQSLETPRGVTPKIRLDKAREEFDYWFERGNSFFKVSRYCLKEQDHNTAAFLLHQSTESYYAALMLVFTDYKAKTHDLEEINSIASKLDEALKEVFPCRTEKEEHHFELLRKAYKDARYRKDYTITPEELQYLSERVLLLRELTEKLCEEEMQRLKEAINGA